jgi:hypothetical protein
MISDDKTAIYATITLAILITIISYFGIFYPLTYAAEAAPWHAQCFGQDIVNLTLLVPVLLVSGILSHYKSRAFLIIYCGALLYTAYTFAIYCFAVHYNFLFIAYCAVLGLSFYSFIYLIASMITQPINEWYNEQAPVRTTGAYLMACALIFYFLWLSVNIPAGIHNTIPADITQNGLFTNPVHVLDLSFFLPGLVITAILLLKRTSLGFLLAPAVLVFCLLMDITIATLAVVMNQKGIDAGFSVVWIMAVLAAICIYLIYGFFRHLQPGGNQLNNPLTTFQ